MRLRLFRIANRRFMAVQIDRGQPQRRLLMCPVNTTPEEIAAQDAREQAAIAFIAHGFNQENRFRHSAVVFAPEGAADLVVRAGSSATAAVVHVVTDASTVDESVVGILCDGIENAAALYLVTSPLRVTHVPDHVELASGNRLAVRSISLAREPVFGSHDSLAIEVWDSLLGESGKLRKDTPLWRHAKGKTPRP